MVEYQQLYESSYILILMDEWENIPVALINNVRITSFYSEIHF